MSTFQKRKTSREVEILGQRYLVDFGRDNIPSVFKQVQEGIKKIQQEEASYLGQAHFDVKINSEKELLKKAIGEIILSSETTQTMLDDEDTLVLHRDIYAFLVEEYIEVMSKKSPYDIERIEGHKSFD